jgi:hypothetical protein
LSIRAAQKRGFLNFSNSYYYNAIDELGNLVLKEKISLKEFLLNITTNVKITDATLHKRSGKKVYGVKKLKNYVLGNYGLYQDVLFTTELFEGMDYITDFKVINHNKRHLTKPKEIEKAIKSGKIRKGDWIIIDGGLKSGKIAKESRSSGVKLVTRLNKNFVAIRFGKEVRKADILSNIKPIERTIDGKSLTIYPFKRCIWQGTAGNLFLIKGEGSEDFIPLFTTSLSSKSETIIKRYKERSQIEQTHKELKSHLDAEGSYFRTKKSNYAHIFILSLIHNIIQYLRLFLREMSFKDVLEELALYLLWKNPPKSVLWFKSKLERVFRNIDFKRLNKLNIGLMWIKRIITGVAT